jgi:hypothetical protein
MTPLQFMRTAPRFVILDILDAHSTPTYFGILETSKWINQVDPETMQWIKDGWLNENVDNCSLSDMFYAGLKVKLPKK